MQKLPNQLIKYKKSHQNERETERGLWAKPTKVELNASEVESRWWGITIKSREGKIVLNLNTKLKKLDSNN